MQVQT